MTAQNHLLLDKVLIAHGGPDQRMAYTPDRIAIETTKGKVIAERSAPRELFRDLSEIGYA
jgi:hypothetical protein